MYRCIMVTHSVTADGVSLQGMGGPRAGVAHLEAGPQSFSDELNVCGAVDKCVAFLTAREAGLAKGKKINHYQKPTF